MTNGWIDIKNTDMMLIMGGNPAENHPCGFKWPIEAKLHRNAKMIVVDPRFTRTAAHGRSLPADPRRRRHRLSRRPDQLRDSEQPHRAKTISSTTPTRPSSSRKDSNCLRTVCSRVSIRRQQLTTRQPGTTKQAARSTRQRSRSELRSRARSSAHAVAVFVNGKRRRQRLGRQRRRAAAIRLRAVQAQRARADRSRRRCCRRTSLTISRCNIRARVFQLLKQQYSRYTPEMVERITGIPKDQFLKAADCSRRFAKTAT